MHPMTKHKDTKKPSSPCGCKNCLCRRRVRCHCHDYNALLTLALWDFGRALRRRKNINQLSP